MTAPGAVMIRDGAALAAACAAWLADAMSAAVTARGACAIALSGGGSPRPVYAALADDPLRDQVNWSLVHVYFGDERAVPPDHHDSNYHMARETLLSRVPIPAAQIHRLEAERADQAAAAADYDALLPEALDLLVLGMGPDGHTASLFPDSPALAETARRVVPVVGPKPPPQRLTITPPVIAAAQRVVMIAPGAEKAPAVAQALAETGDARAVPARLARHGTWFLDFAAAARLGARR